MTDKAVLMERQGEICTVTLNRPSVMNAFNEAILTGLMNVFEKIAVDQSIKVVILQGAGHNFSSGADMQLLYQGAAPPERLIMMKGLSKLIITIRELPQPVISKVRGVAYGVGSNLALAGDFAVAAHDARFCEVFVKIGVILDGGGHYFLPRLVGPVKARELALLGNEISGQEAESIGMIYKSVPPEDLDSEIDALARQLAEKSLKAMALIKEGLEGSLGMTLKDVMEWEAAHQSIMLQTEEHKQVVRDFLKSRRKIA